MSAITAIKRKSSATKHSGIRIHPHRKLSWDRLPFVGKDHGRLSNWDVPLTGNFFTACEAGKTIAHIYLKYVRDERDNPVAMPGFLLSQMIKDLMAKEPRDEQEDEVKRGQFAGFIGELSRWLESAAWGNGINLSLMDEQVLVDRVNLYLDVGVAKNLEAAIAAKSATVTGSTNHG